MPLGYIQQDAIHVYLFRGIQFKHHTLAPLRYAYISGIIIDYNRLICCPAYDCKFTLVHFSPFCGLTTYRKGSALVVVRSVLVSYHSPVAFTATGV